ncbi:MAG: RNA polymerase sigma factor [Bacteroidales bacterium]
MHEIKEKYIIKDFPELFEDYREKVFNLAHKMTGDINVAEDVTQETFIKCYENLKKFRGDSHVFTWLFTITKNNCLRIIDKQKRNTSKELEQLLNTVSDDQIDYFDNDKKTNYINQVREGCLLGLLKTLSFNQRIAFIMNVLQKHSIEVTAKIVDKSESATRTLIHRARKNIKEFLCKNCSLYNVDNSCKCENMINFSLKQGWIKYNEFYPIDLPEKVEKELKDSQKIFKLYSSLPVHLLPKKVSERMKNSDFLIFSEKKVK